MSPLFSANIDVIVPATLENDKWPKSAEAFLRVSCYCKRWIGSMGKCWVLLMKPSQFVSGQKWGGIREEALFRHRSVWLALCQRSRGILAKKIPILGRRYMKARDIVDIPCVDREYPCVGASTLIVSSAWAISTTRTEQNQHFSRFSSDLWRKFISLIVFQTSFVPFHLKILLGLNVVYMATELSLEKALESALHDFYPPEYVPRGLGPWLQRLCILTWSLMLLVVVCMTPGWTQRSRKAWF